MALFDPFGPDVLPSDADGPADALRRVVYENRLARVMAFARVTIDEVVNCRIAKNKVLGYYKVSKLIDRRGEILELEKQWNPTGAG
jgi:hypothetical protein